MTVTQKRPTITDVASLAGVSVGTVSNVLNGTIPVSESRRERVLKVIQELGYSQNVLAQGLRRKRSPIVGVCVPHTSIAYFSALMEAFEEIASIAGFEIMQVLSRGDGQKEYQRVQSLLRYHVGGLLLVPTVDPEATYEIVAASGVPVVVVDRAPLETFPFDRVGFDNRDAMLRVMQGLIERGHRNILFIVQQKKLIVTQQRIEGLRAAAEACAEPVITKIVEVGQDQSSFAAALAGELQRRDRATAMIASNSILAAFALRAFRTLRLDCPRDISLIAFDEPVWADLVTPALSVVCQPTRDIARVAWTFLMQRMRNEAEGVQQIQLEAPVVFRGSVRSLVAG
jgi:LacI family transcriptional regulator